MNRYPLWKNLLVLIVLLVAGLYALPNLYGDDPAVQISAGRTATVDLALADKAEKALKTAGIEYKGAQLEDDKLLIRLTSADNQLKAKDALSKALVGDYIIALNLPRDAREFH